MATGRDVSKDEFDDESPIEQVRLTVPTTDDTTLPALTFRAVVLGLFSCTVLALCDALFTVRKNPIAVSAVVVQLLALPIGRLMAATLPTRTIRVPGMRWEFTMNPGPFNIKEHVLITILAKGGSSSLAIMIVGAMKAYFHRSVNPIAMLLLLITTNMMGYGFAGMFMKILVDSPYMWWPTVLVDVSFYRVLHEKEVRARGQLRRLQFFLLVFVSSFAYYAIPNYFFPSITALSFVCWIWKDSVTAQQLGSGLNGLALGAISLDWATLVSYMGTPFAIPTFGLVSSMIGFIAVVYVIGPIAYWTNIDNAKRFPFYSLDVFDDHGQTYNLSRVLNQKSFEFDQKGYESYSKLHLSTMYALSYGFNFAVLTSTLSHVALFYGRSIWSQVKKAYGNQRGGDIHNRLMQAYDPIPQWWFYAILFLTFGLAILSCEGFGKQLQLPYWGIILSALLIFIFIIPLGVIKATTGQGAELGVISELIIGYLHPGRPLSNVAFKSFSVSSMGTAIELTYDLKLGHYMKIPPRAMFFAQITGTMVGSLVSFSVTWWIFSSVKNICHPDLLPKGSPWTCTSANIFSTVMTIWGIVGPSRVFYPSGIYAKLYLFFIIGAVTPVLVWILSRKFKKDWIKLISVPNIFMGAVGIPPATAMHYWLWFAVGISFNYFVYRKYRTWWGRYNYVLSIGLDTGVAAMAFITSVTLQIHDINGIEWWGLDFDDHCPLAQCPTSPDVVVEGCPTFH